MDYPAHLAQFRRLLANIEAQRCDMLDEPFHIEPGVYWRPERYASEVERVFRRAPLVLGHASQLPKPGDVLALDVLGVPLLLAHGRDGRIRGMLNVCRHRGTRLMNGADVQRKSSFMCPYHNWTYDLSGALKHIPCEEGFPGLDRAKFGLTPIPLEVRHGMIWAAVDPAANFDLNGFLCGIGGDLDVFGFPEMHFFTRAMTPRRTNWKLIVDAFLESYHVRRLHRKTVGPYFLDNMAVLDRVGPHIRSAVARQEFSEIARLPETAWDGRLHGTFAYYLFPNTILVLHPDYTSILTMFPLAPDETMFSHTMLTPRAPRDAKEADHWQRSFELIENGVFQAEDLFIAEQAQLGMRSGANKTMIFGRYELGIRVFHETLDAWLATDSIANDQ